MPWDVHRASEPAGTVDHVELEDLGLQVQLEILVQQEVVRSLQALGSTSVSG
jgi:hypothetical protein